MKYYSFNAWQNYAGDKLGMLHGFMYLDDRK